MVYNLIDVHLLSKQESDKKEDFHNVFDFDTAFNTGLTLTLQ
jgi:uncharacterized repeat protein (TIGR04138 family)